MLKSMGSKRTIMSIGKPQYCSLVNINNEGSLNFTSVQGGFFAQFFPWVFLLRIRSPVMSCKRYASEFFQSWWKKERKIVLSFKACSEECMVIVCLHFCSVFSISIKDVVSLMKFKYTFRSLLEYALPPSLWGSAGKGLPHLSLKLFLDSS